MGPLGRSWKGSGNGGAGPIAGPIVEEHGWRLHAFVLMANHEHLFVETPQPNPSRGMKLLNGSYTQFFNGRR